MGDDDRIRMVREWIETGMDEPPDDAELASSWSGTPIGEVRNMLLAIESGLPPWHGGPPEFSKKGEVSDG